MKLQFLGTGLIPVSESARDGAPPASSSTTAS